MDKDLSVLDLDGHALERGANAWPPDTLSRCRLKDRAVVGTHQVPAIDSKKLVIHPVQGDTNVWAPVSIGVKRSLIVEEHSIDGRLAIAKDKLLSHTGRQFANVANQLSFGWVQTHALELNQPGERYFLPGNLPGRPPGLHKPATDKETLPRTGQRYKAQFLVRRVPRGYNTSDTAHLR